MREYLRQLVDQLIDRRTFIRRLGQAGISAAGASALANSVGARADSVPAGDSTPVQGRLVTNMTGGDVMLEFLEEWDVPYLFGLAGSEEVGLLDALVDRDVPFVTCLHENAAMAMADGYSRSTGQTSIVSLHSVAGAAYALGQIVGSYRDRVPVVVCAGRQATDYRGQDGFLEAADLHTLPQDYAQWTWDVMSAQTIPEVLRRAFMFAETPPGGPTFITFSNDLWEQTVKQVEILPRLRSEVEDGIPPPHTHVKRIADYLTGAKRPVIFLGNECARYNPSDAIAQIAELTGSLVMLSNKIPIVFPTTHPNFAGQFHNDDVELSPTIDCFWSVGGHMFKRAQKPQAPLISRAAVTMHTSLAVKDVGRNYPVDTAAFANVVTTAELVLAELKSRDLATAANRKRQQWVAVYDADRRKTLAAEAKKEWDKNPIAVSRLMIELDRVMDDKAYIVSEVVTSSDQLRKYLTFDHRVPQRERRQNFDTASGILGWGLAAAIGTKIGNPGKEVWCLTGDGCFNFGSQALWSAARYKVPIGIVIFNNGQYQANRLNQNRSGGHRMKATGKYIGVNLGHPDIDYTAMCASYGIRAERVTEPDQVKPALERCRVSMRAGEPYVVDVKIGKRFEGLESDWYDFFSVAELQNA